MVSRDRAIALQPGSSKTLSQKKKKKDSALGLPFLGHFSWLPCTAFCILAFFSLPLVYFCDRLSHIVLMWQVHVCFLFVSSILSEPQVNHMHTET